ncbi:MAG: hypothetical protein NT062_30115 [Proteobacteria bacterium]|nr:hypothetical protein [Pseudomonadota bacterium]
MAGRRRHRPSTGRAGRAQLLEHRRPVHDGHRDVEQDEIDGDLLQLGEADLAVLGLLDLEAELDHVLADDAADGVGIVDG